MNLHVTVNSKEEIYEHLENLHQHESITINYLIETDQYEILVGSQDYKERLEKAESEVVRLQEELDNRKHIAKVNQLRRRLMVE